MTNDYIKLPVMVVENCQSSLSLLHLLLAHKGFKNLVLMVDNTKVLSYLPLIEINLRSKYSTGNKRRGER